MKQLIETMPSELSPAAKKLYTLSAQNGHTLQNVGNNRDKPWWSEDLQPAIDELVKAGLAKYEVSNWGQGDRHYLWTTRVMKKYTKIDGRSDGMHVRVRVVGEKAWRYDDDQETMVLADFNGAYIERRDSTNSILGQQWRIVTRHENGTDFEHDSMVVGEIYLRNVDLIDVYNDGTTVLLGTISQTPRLYARNEDPFSYANGDYRPNEDGSIQMCDYHDACKKNPHPIGPFMPPEVPDLIGRLVSVVYSPRKKKEKSS